MAAIDALNTRFGRDTVTFADREVEASERALLTVLYDGLEWFTWSPSRLPV